MFTCSTRSVLCLAALLAMTAPGLSAQVLPGQAVPADVEFSAPPPSSIFSDLVRQPPAARTVTFGRSAQATAAKLPAPAVAEPPTATDPAPAATMPRVVPDPQITGPSADIADPPSGMSPGLTALPSPGSQFTGQPRVLDGATLDFSDTTIRLTGGLVVPEPGRTCLLGPTRWSCGELSKRALERLIAGRTVTCTVIGTDADMAEGSCYVGRDDLSAAMVESGMAKARASSLQAAADRAKDDRRGLWTTPR